MYGSEEWITSSVMSCWEDNDVSKKPSIVLARSKSQQIGLLLRKEDKTWSLIKHDYYTAQNLHAHKFFPSMPYAGNPHALDFLGIKGNVDRKYLKQF